MSDDPKPQAQADKIAQLIADLERVRVLQVELAEIQARLPAGVAAEIGASETKGLASNAYNATIESMSATEIDKPPSKRQPGAPLESTGPFAKAARTLGMSAAKLARELDINYQTTRAWDQPGRRVPDDVQPRIDRLIAERRKKPVKPVK